MSIFRQGFFARLTKINFRLFLVGLPSGFYSQAAGRVKPTGGREPVNIDPIKFLKNAKNAPRPVLLTAIALAIVGAIIRHQNAVIVLSLVAILLLIVLSLILGSLRPR